MSATGTDTMYDLLPAIHRILDVEGDQSLRALLDILETQASAIEEDIAQLYDDWFIETCDEWVVPYIGDLLSVRGILPIDAAGITERAVVANTIAYRRRKGTVAVLEQLVRDVSGWPARAVEFFQLLATTQYMNHVRLSNVVTPDLRRGDALELIGSAFDTSAHTADVRHVDNGRGRYAIPNVGLFLWRLESYRTVRSDARPAFAATPAEAGRYRFHPVGLDAPLFNLARAEGDIDHLALETDVPGPIRRRALAEELRARQAGTIDEAAGRDGYFGTPPVVAVFIDGSETPVPLDQLVVCDLSDPPEPIADGWRRPPNTVTAAIDPVLGRLALPSGASATSVEVTYAYGFPGDLGGGPYDRHASVLEAIPTSATPTWQAGVSPSAVPADAPTLWPTLAAAIAAWNAAPTTLGVIAVMDSHRYEDPLPTVTIPEGTTLVIAAADWPLELDGLTRRPGRLVPSGRRPHVLSGLSVVGTAPVGSLRPGGLVVDGLLIEGVTSVLPGHLGSLRLAHTTVVPAPAVDVLSVAANPVAGQDNAELHVTLERVITGRIGAAETIAGLSIRESIVDGQLPDAPAGVAITAGDLDVQASTVLGSMAVRTLHAGNYLATGIVTVERRQVGCVRYSYVPPGSLVPRRFHCQPPDGADATRIVPRFTTTRYGDPAYAQLATDGPAELATTAEGEGEIGAWHFLHQPQRLRNVRTSLEEYLRLGLEAGIFLAT